VKAPRVDHLAAAVLVVCWSSGFVGATLAARTAPVETILAWRTLLSALVLGGWALLRSGWLVPAAEVLRQAVLGLLVQVLYLGGVFVAADVGVSASTSALIAALQPLLVAALAGRLLAEPTTRRQRHGLVVGAVGVTLVVSGDLRGGSAPAWAYLLPIAALIALATGTVLEQHWKPTQSLVSSLALQSSVAAGVFCVVAAAHGQLAPPPDGQFWLATCWLVGLSTFGGYGSYLFVVRRSGATRASTLLYLTPPTTAVWAWLLFGQAPRLLALPGAIVCAASLFLALAPAVAGAAPAVSGASMATPHDAAAPADGAEP
jgi:drug/metabolite transporter (DMT)-like permease